MTGPNHSADPRGLILEAFRIDGITEADCRSIFFDWALGCGDAADLPRLIETLLARHAAAPADHPMRQVLLEGLGRRAGVAPGAAPRRTGRRRARSADAADG